MTTEKKEAHADSRGEAAARRDDAKAEAARRGQRDKRDTALRRKARERAGPGQGIAWFGNLPDPELAGLIGPADRIAEPDPPAAESPAGAAAHSRRRRDDDGEASGEEKDGTD